jgi:hypothetical protein
MMKEVVVRKQRSLELELENQAGEMRPRNQRTRGDETETRELESLDYCCTACLLLTGSYFGLARLAG